MQKVLAYAALALFACCANSVSASRPVISGTASENATTYLGNPAHDGNMNFAAGFAPPYQQVWSRDMIYPVSYVSPVIADGRLFVTGDKFIFSLDLANGHTKWAKEGNEGMLTYDNGTLFSVNSDGFLTSIDSQTGKKKWQIELPNQYQFTSPPVAVNGKIFDVGSGVGGDMYSVDETTGNINWDIPLKFGGTSASVTVADGIYLAFNCHYEKYDIATGNKVWAVKTGTEQGDAATAVYFNNELLVQDDMFCGDDTVRKAKNGAEVGSFVSEWQWTPAVFQDAKGRYLGANVQQDATGWVLHCWNIKTGKQLWTYKADNTITTMPVVINGRIFVGTAFGGVFAVDENGHEVWSTTAPHKGAGINELAAGQGMLFVFSDSIVTAYAPQ